ncbi:MAG: hypothetical protein E6I43_02970 [Chloroflexi bacterium]|nr:MAG: hypothetical protein E6I43_02970 [Chloroflexota bacterium]
MPVAAVAILVAGCTPTAAVRPAASDTPTASPSPAASPSPTPSASESPSPTPTPSGVDPGFVPALSAIQMVGPRLGWAVGAHAIFATADGTHWTKQYDSTEEFVAVDFISATTGWAVATRTLIGTSDGGHTWRQLGEPRMPLRSIHFATPTQGWGIAGGSDPQQSHGWLIPHEGATLAFTYDGGSTWSTLDGPANPQTVCFSDPAQGWIGTAEGVFIYRNTDLGHNWSKVLQRPDQQPGLPQATLIQCAAPQALWVLFTGGPSAMSHSPYIAYATVDGSTWKAVMKESMSEGQILPGVPAGPDTYPPSFSVVDPQDAVFIGDGPATNVAQCVVASNGGAILRRTGRIDNAPETFAAAFVSVTAGWVLTRNAGGDYVIDATSDGGYHWSQQLAVPPTSAG